VVGCRLPEPLLLACEALVLRHLACVCSQIGEAMQVHSGGVLRATPHCVRAASGPAAAGVARNAFAVFMQPDVTAPMDTPEGEDRCCACTRATQALGHAVCMLGLVVS